MSEPSFTITFCTPKQQGKSWLYNLWMEHKEERSKYLWMKHKEERSKWVTIDIKDVDECSPITDTLYPYDFKFEEPKENDPNWSRQPIPKTWPKQQVPDECYAIVKYPSQIWRVQRIDPVHERVHINQSNGEMSTNRNGWQVVADVNVANDLCLRKNSEEINSLNRTINRFAVIRDRIKRHLREKEERRMLVSKTRFHRRRNGVRKMSDLDVENL